MLLAAASFGGAACAAGPTTAAGRVATLQVRALTQATIRNLVVEVSGPGIDPAVLVNLPVDTAGIASGVIATTAGSGRRISVTFGDVRIPQSQMRKGTHH